jgi:HTH-type transcriptional regulator, sugar sensing transcriptional regulator
MSINIRNVLSKLGIEDKKAEIYLSCLERGGETAYFLAKKVGLKRPTAYDILYSLQKDGLVYISIKNNKKLFYPADPEVLMRKIKEREKDLNEAMPLLQSMYNSPKTKPNILYFEGVEGIKQVYNDNLKALKRGDEILAYGGEDIVKYMPKYTEHYVNERVKIGIIVRALYKRTKEGENYISKSKEQLREFRLVDPRLFDIQNEVLIYKNKVAITSFGKEMFGMIIESREIYNSQKAMFELAWRGAETLK